MHDLFTNDHLAHQQSINKEDPSDLNLFKVIYRTCSLYRYIPANENGDCINMKMLLSCFSP